MPVQILISVILFFTNDGKIFFIQPRPGRHEKIFHIIKFRTMNNKRDRNGNPLPDSERTTRFGKFIRRSSLDELPQLINVVRGDLSLIGPRPLLVEYLPLYNDYQKRRHDVRPGITGLAQVNGRNAISWRQKFEFDVWYVNNLSLLLDLKIIKQTILKTIKSEGINSSSSETMSKFTGE
jgi:lipopolysaccharide/colanic/teichoic acid biosynthesis glycosyltransferase